MDEKEVKILRERERERERTREREREREKDEALFLKEKKTSGYM